MTVDLSIPDEFSYDQETSCTNRALTASTATVTATRSLVCRKERGNMTKGGAINPSPSAERDSGVGEQGSDLRACRDQTMSDVSTAASSTKLLPERGLPSGFGGCVRHAGHAEAQVRHEAPAVAKGLMAVPLSLRG